MNRRMALSRIFSATSGHGGLDGVSFNPLKHVDPVGTILLPGTSLLLRSSRKPVAIIKFWKVDASSKFAPTTGLLVGAEVAVPKPRRRVAAN